MSIGPRLNRRWIDDSASVPQAESPNPGAHIQGRLCGSLTTAEELFSDRLRQFRFSSLEDFWGRGFITQLIWSEVSNSVMDWSSLGCRRLMVGIS